MESGTSPMRLRILLALLAVALYAPSLWFEFAYDDFHQIVLRPAITGEAGKPAAVTPLFTAPTFPGDLYRPLTIASYWLQYRVSGAAPAAYHLLNILLFTVCVVAVFELGLPLLRSRGAAVFGAALFAAHPLHVEAVANVVGRAELLAAALGFGACLAVRRERRRRGIVSAVIMFTAACFCKESALVLLPLIPWYARLCGQDEQRMRFSQIAALVAALAAGAACYLIARGVVLGGSFGAAADPAYYHPENPLLFENWFARVLPGLELLGHYLSLLAVPIGLQIDYSLGYQDFWRRVYSLRGFLFLSIAALFLFVLWRMRRSPAVFFGVWTCAAFALTLNILVPIGTIMGDRLAFLPSVGFTLFAAELLAGAALRCRCSPRSTAVLAVLLIGSFAGLTCARLPVWSNNQTVFEQAVKDNPRSSKSAVALAMYWYYRAHDVPRAKEWFKKTLQIDPTNMYAARHLIDIAMKERQPEEAEHYCRLVLQYEPSDQQVRQTLDALIKVREALEHERSGRGADR